ncbi:MAG: hypothetical protein ACYTGL_30910 [Planctomycetota bacterium]|jgi:hypothetical protein
MLTDREMKAWAFVLLLALGLSFCFGAIAATAHAAEPPATHKFYAFVAPSNAGRCIGCEQLKADLAANRDRPWNVYLHVHDPRQFPQVKVYPTIVDHTGAVYTTKTSSGEVIKGGYDNWQNLTRWVKSRIDRPQQYERASKAIDEAPRKPLPKELDAVPDASAASAVSPETAAQLELAQTWAEMQQRDLEEKQARAEAATEHDIDWSGVRVIVAVSDSVPSGLRMLEGPVKRTLEQITGGKAELLIVAERTHPTAFADYCQTLTVVVDRAHVAILIPKLAKGIARGIVAKKIARGVLEWKSQLPESLHNIPFEEIFERLNGREYHHLVELSVTANAERKVIDGDQEHDWSLYSTLSLIATYLVREFWKGRRDKQAMRAMGEATLEDEPPVPTRKKTTRRKGSSRVRSSA